MAEQESLPPATACVPRFDVIMFADGTGGPPSVTACILRSMIIISDRRDRRATIGYSLCPAHYVYHVRPAEQAGLHRPQPVFHPLRLSCQTDGTGGSFIGHSLCPAL